MHAQNRGPLDFLDQIYTVAFWMTGSLKKTNDLVYKTYRKVDSETSEVQLFKTFRNVYYECFCPEASSLVPQEACDNTESLESENNKQIVDGRLAVLLTEVCKLKHQAISVILNRPVEKVRLLLTSERKSLLLGLLNLALACCVEPCYA